MSLNQLILYFHQRKILIDGLKLKIGLKLYLSSVIWFFVKLVYYGPDADKSPTDKKLLAEFNSLKNKIQKFLNKYYPFFLDTNKKSTKGTIMLSDHINTLLIDEALCNFAQNIKNH